LLSILYKFLNESPEGAGDNKMSVFSESEFSRHELVTFHHDRKSGLLAIIAVHSTRLGPAVGGCRMFPYANDDAALHDVLRLSRGMSYKSALAGLPFGGGKSVIIGDPQQDKTRELLLAMGDFINGLGGKYVAAEDSGTGVEDIRIMGERTAYVSGVMDTAKHGGDPSPSTAYGVYLGIRTAVKHRLGVEELKGIRVSIQGLGHVGYFLASLLIKDGATVYGADLNQENLNRAVSQLGVIAADPDQVLAMEVDVFAPCAMGAVLNSTSVPQIKAGIIAGAANNQLETPEQCDHLMDRGILYCPDFLVNAGGIIDVYHQRAGSEDIVRQAHIDRIGPTLEEVLRRADESHRPTQLIAEELAEEYADHGVPGISD
jgi:leucine dehydrogenase